MSTVYHTSRPTAPRPATRRRRHPDQRRGKPILLASVIALLAWLLPPPDLWADLCPPLPVEQGNVCECKVANYGQKTRTLSVFKVIDEVGTVLIDCSGLIIAPMTIGLCVGGTVQDFNCGCVTRGEGKSGRVSLSTYDPSGGNIQPTASVGCR